MSVYQKAKAAGLQIDSHESDLYLKDSPEAQKILREENATTARRFISQVDGLMWWDVPFEFDPFWERVANRVAR